MKYAYERIKADIRNRVRSGSWQPGEKLPSSRDFAAHYGTSVNTVEKAIKELAQEGLLTRDSRRGTFAGGMPEAAPPSSSVRSGLIAAFVVGIENPVWASALRGIDDEVHQYGYSLLSSSDEGSSAKLESMVKGLVAKKVDGLIMCPIVEHGRPNKNAQLVRMLSDNGIQTVFLDRYAYDMDVPYVTSDNQIGSYKLTRLLFEHGHRNILFVRNSNLTTMNERWLGFQQAHADLGCEFSERLDVFIPTENEDFKLEFEAYCSAFERKMKEMKFTAVFCANDQIAEAALISLEKLGYRVPEQISVVTYDAANINYRLRLNLTGMNQPFYDMGRTAAKQLMQMIQGIERPAVIGHTCSSSLYLGSSVKPANSL
ncbi:GntR family transcriptional regulator [Paenibacillus doosanensis]|uniref:Arabinose metabolism transcriptional repressor n=1 Tax=Paenibacillus konkukensis TaxID=2020716 RepID=A0ABY4S2L7_9BACL|nr:MULTISPECIES: GntR family transcriptional regulator [Paenibacillus]MCS7460437.1 GntR family transcriptional regulator [Paenibacillus doosanensis]UQZ87464.1 Arabinose metabolism transcriptional repressor [Paenibacillus konkukensis]